MAKNASLELIKEKKQLFKDTIYRKRFDNLAKEINDELVDTGIVSGKLLPNNGISHTRLITQRNDGAYDFVDLPNLNKASDSGSKVPNAKEPIAFSKILVATSSITSKAPDGSTFSVNKIKARAFYDLWKRTWTLPEANGLSTLQTTAQNLFTYGWAAWRVFPKRVEVKKSTDNGKKVPKILFDDIFRQPLDVRRTWLGLTYKPTQNNNRPEVYYEYDITKDEYEKMKKRYGKRIKAKSDTAGVSDEAEEQDGNISKTHVTICVYENPLENRMIVASSSVVFYDDEMPNDEVYGSVVVAHCFSRDMQDPYGVGLYELMRGNVAMYNYINSLDAMQVEAEVHPILFAVGNSAQQGGEMKYTRSPNVINTLPAGTKIERVLTSGNTTLGINYADKQKQNLEENTGVNNIVSGSNSETTLGATVLLKEAALNRLVIPRNSLAQAIENDACITFSWFEQEFANTRDYIFSTEEEVRQFIEFNKMLHTEEFNETETEEEYSEDGMPITEKEEGDDVKIKVRSSVRVPMSFDYNNEDLTESDYENQNVNELGASPVMLSRASVIKGVTELDNPEKIGYDKVTLKVDTNSMIVPSVEIQKQAAMQLFPIVQSTIQLIFGLARQDPDQAVVQLQALKEFLEVQKVDIYKFIPKDKYDAIMQGTLEQPMMLPGQMGATQSDGTSVMQPQSPQEMQAMANNGSPMSSAYNATVGRAAS